MQSFVAVVGSEREHNIMVARWLAVKAAMVSGCGDLRLYIYSILCKRLLSVRHVVAYNMYMH